LFPRYEVEVTYLLRMSAFKTEMGDGGREGRRKEREGEREKGREGGREIGREEGRKEGKRKEEWKERKKERQAPVRSWDKGNERHIAPMMINSKP
jgi:flagellar biosynthesis/type III secretory pathway protein FliH